MGARIEIDCLNCGAGDISLSWNANDPMEIERAMRVVKDMIRRGYALFVKGTDGKMTKVKAFDEADGCYLIADGPEGSAPPSYIAEPEPAAEPTEPQQMPEPELKKKRGRPVKMSHAKVVAVGRSAGG